MNKSKNKSKNKSMDKNKVQLLSFSGQYGSITKCSGCLEKRWAANTEKRDRGT